MGETKHSKDEKKEIFSYDDSPDKNKFTRRKYIALGLGGGTVVSLIILASIFSEYLALFSSIFMFYCIYLWILPLIFALLRNYKVSLYIKRESKIGRIYMTIGIYFFFLWIVALIGLISYLAGGNIVWVAYTLFWGTTCVYAPFFLFILITRL